MKTVIFTAMLFIILLVAVSCGGVQRNPAQPPWGQEGQNPNAPPKAGAEEGKAAGGQGKIIEGDYATLIPQAEAFLEKGDIENAFNAYHSALQQKAGDPQAGMGKVICQIAKDWRTFAIFRGAGADKLYYNTPLLMHPELLPDPITADDSYLLRVLTIGRHYEEIFTLSLPSWGSRPINPNKTVTPPTGPEGEKKPAEGEKPKEPPKEGPPTVPPPPNGGTQPITPPPGAGGGNTNQPQGLSHDGWEPLANRYGQQTGGPAAGGPEDWEKIQEKLKESNGQLPPGMGQPTQPEGAPVAQLQEGTKPIDSDYFKTELPLTIAKLDDEAATFRIENFRMLPQNMQTNIKSLIDLLESIASGVKDDFTFQAGFVLRDKTEKYEIIFRKADYDLLLAELRILAGITDYVTSYNSNTGTFSYIYQPKDANTDGHYSADEYYPAVPYGTIMEGGQDLLATAQDDYLQGLTSAAEAWDLVLERALNAPTETTNELLAIAKGTTQGATPLEIQKKLYNDLASKFDDSIEMTIDAKGGPVEMKVAPAVLFKNVLGDVRALLPCIDMMGALIPCTEAVEMWPNPTFAGLFPDGLKDDATVMREGGIKGKAATLNLIIIQGGKITYPTGESDISETGEFLLANVQFNELIGLPVTLTPKEGDAWKGVLHSMTEYIYTMPENFVPQTGLGGSNAPGLGGAPNPGGTTPTRPGGSGAGPGTSTLSP